MVRAATWAVLIFAVIILLMNTFNNSPDTVDETADQAVPGVPTETDANNTRDLDAVEPLTVMEVQSDIVGIWQNNLDANAVDTLNADGTMVSTYDGEELARGTWRVYEDTSAEYNPSGVFMEITVNGEALQYAVITLQDRLLQINYLARGNTLEYQRVQ